MALTVHTPSNVKTIPGFPNYAISKDGRVWSKPRKSKQNHSIGDRVLKGIFNTGGYLRVDLCQESIKCSRLIHRLILESWIGPCPEGMEACHNNGNRTDNRLENLRWDTHSNNLYDSVKHGTHVDSRGGNHGASKLHEEEVRQIVNIYNQGEITQQKLANIFGVARSTIQNIIEKRNWGWLWKEIA